jgi:D12 class N6 adenine-specific DNA methyltransferase
LSGVTPTIKGLLRATPNQLGGKRNQAAAIFRCIREAGYRPGKGHVLCDPFFGGGSISLLAKLLGYRVIAGDTSPRAEAVGLALLVNDMVQLEPEDVAVALTTSPDGWYVPPLKQLPWPQNSLDALASICRAAERVDDRFKRALLRAFMVKVASHISIYGQPRMTAHQRIREKNWDALTDGQIARMLVPQTRPKEQAKRVARSLYGVAFSNGQENEYWRADCLTVIEAAKGADVVYLDPPYPGTEGYSRNYVGIDAMLEGHELVIEESRFTQSHGWRYLKDVLDRCADVPLVVMSLGAENVHVGREQLEELMRDAGREVTAKTISYSLLRSRATDKSSRKQEWLLTGVKR